MLISQKPKTVGQAALKKKTTVDFVNKMNYIYYDDIYCIFGVFAIFTDGFHNF